MACAYVPAVSNRTAWSLLGSSSRAAVGACRGDSNEETSTNTTLLAARLRNLLVTSEHLLYLQLCFLLVVGSR